MTPCRGIGISRELNTKARRHKERPQTKVLDAAFLCAFVPLCFTIRLFPNYSMSARVLLVFALTEFFLSLSPGPAVMLVVSQGMKYGAARSVRGTIGILTANAIYFALSAIGLGAILLASARVFTIVTWVGAAYLAYLGVKMLFFSGHFFLMIRPPP